ncbi:hypothetical protein B0H67DRAFT_638339 [Lasiosphaeris hirsuta]|uniref:Uncharacterized protein n=1 Tax=Lasiosphaeris hirsuta TaxID=260670 RepID=A0AA40B8V2_9PEZI|nr:hypothetical protein B0H67DRAFT_638339 [Lasiosphaeris hirsuta]
MILPRNLIAPRGNRVPELDAGAPIIESFLPLELRSPRGGGGGSGGSGGGSSGGSGGGRGGGSSSSSSSSKSGGSSSTSTSSSGSGSGSGSGSSSSSGTKSGSSSKSGGSTVVIYNTGYGPNGTLLIPVWAIILLVIISIMILVFLSALVYYYRKEKKTDQKTRHLVVWWKAFTIPTLLFIPIKLAKRYQKRKAGVSLTSTLLNAPATSYTKIEPDHYAAPTTTANASAPYGEGGTGYNGALAPGKYDHHRLSTTTTLGSTSTTPEPLPYVAAPPPYSSAPPPLPGVPGQAPPPAPLGLAADYFAQQPLNTGSPQPSPGPAAVTFPTTATRPPVVLGASAPIHNPYSMSATYMPEGRPP